MPSKLFGPTDSVADALTQVGSTYQMPVGPNNQTVVWYIYQALVAKGNVVNAKECSGHIMISTSQRSYYFAYGNGVGGATNGHTGPAEKIECAIPIPANTQLKVYVLDATAAKDVTVSIHFSTNSGFCIVGKLQANPETFRTMAGGGISANGDTAADTPESFTSSAKLTGASMIPELSGKIYQIRYAGAGIVDAKANSAKLILYIAGQVGPFEYALGNGPSGATLGGPAPADVIDIPEGVQITMTSAVNAEITSAEAVKTPAISLSYW